MAELERGGNGRFAAKGNSIRAFRGIRLTDFTWNTLGEKADELDISRADYLEGLFSGEIDWQADEVESNESELDFDIEEVAEILKKCLEITGKTVSRDIKKKIKQVLEIMGQEIEED